MKKYIDLGLAILFLICAALQFNDPDSIVWILIYLGVMVLPVLSLTGKLEKAFPIIMLIILFLLIIDNFHFFTQWIENGMPDILEDEGVKKGEGLREFLGLLISMLATMYYLWISIINVPEQDGTGTLH